MEISKLEAIYIAGLDKDFKYYLKSNSNRSLDCNIYCYCKYKHLNPEFWTEQDHLEWLALFTSLGDEIDESQLTYQCFIVNRYVMFRSDEYFKLWNRHLDFLSLVEKQKEAKKKSTTKEITKDNK